MTETEPEYLVPQPRVKPKARFDLRPSAEFWFIPILVIVQVGLFLFMGFQGVDWLAPRAEDLLDWGALNRTSVINQQYWRLFTGAFIHAGVFHLGMNMFILMVLGRILEPVLGWVKLSGVVAVTLLASSLASIAWHPIKVGVGFSGVIFGLLACLMVLLIFRSKAFGAMLGQIIVLVIVMCVDLLLALFSERIDHAAHGGGFVVGLLCGGLLIPGLIKAEWDTMSGGLIGMLGMLVFIASFIVIQNLPDPLGRYLRVQRSFLELKIQEEALLNPLLTADSLSQVNQVYSDRAEAWQNQLERSDSLSLNEFPASLQDRLSLMRLYSQLKVKQNNLWAAYYQSDQDSLFVAAAEMESKFIQLDSSLRLP
ncbi:MAG: rhomboid family intramembrane serine protease [Bacteroidetes bacterium]|nr:MAG: rhomboid family intramembrane serine protease [Bacteroidota bacterium]